MKQHCLLVIMSMLAFGLQQARADEIQTALAMFETGAVDPRQCAADRRRGASGEVSRYQIMPAVWRQYSRSTQYDNPVVAWSVAERILTDRTNWFQQNTRRQPTPVELYLLWNKPGHFSASRFEVNRVRTLFRKRAERFANLVGALENRPKVNLAGFR